MIGVLFTMRTVDKKTETNTTELMGTIAKVENIDTGESLYIEIYTTEYKCALYISSRVSKAIDKDDINDLKKGQTIFFRVENNNLEDFDTRNFSNIVSLKTTEKEILSLSSYNEYAQNAAFPARITCIVIAFIFGLLAKYIKGRLLSYCKFQNILKTFKSSYAV
jgi:hypothetical protein